MIKGTQHKSCSCKWCKAGRATAAGRDARRANERRLRRETRKELRKGEDAFVGPIGSPYTD